MITRKIQRLERRRREAGDDLESSFRDFHASVTAEDGTAPGNVGPMGAEMAGVVNSRFGTEVIETPGSPKDARAPSGAGFADAEGPSEQARVDSDAARGTSEATTNNSSTSEPSQAQQKGDGAEAEWPGTVYDTSDEDEVR